MLEKNEFELLVFELEQAIKNAAKELFANGERFYYFVLSTTGEALAPYICASSHEALERERKKQGYSEKEVLEYGYSSVYAPYFNVGERHFVKVKKLFNERGQSYENEGEFEFRIKVMMQALKNCDASGIFALNQPREEIAINVEVLPPDSGNVIRAKALNPPAAIKQWLINSSQAELDFELIAQDEELYASAARAFAGVACESLEKIVAQIDGEILLTELFVSKELKDEEIESISAATSEILADFARIKGEKIKINFA